MAIAGTIIVLGILTILGWMALAHYGFVAPIHWHWHAAVQSLSQPLSQAASPSPQKTGITKTVLSSTGTVHHAIPPVQGIAWQDPLMLVLLGILVAWILWGTILWLYNAPAAARRWRVWTDWILLRWPIITASYLSHREAWRTDGWHRHQRTWVAASSPTMTDALESQAAMVLDTGFAHSEPDAVWFAQADGMMARRIVIVADAVGIHPQWPQGFHAKAMQSWVQWATQWAEIALHHAGIPGTWTVNPEGIVRRSLRKNSVTPDDNEEPPIVEPPPKPKVGGLAETVRWGKNGLTWGQLQQVAPDPIPVLSAPIPPERVQEVVEVLGKLGFPDTKAIGGQRGLTVDVVKIQPPAALAKRILAESATLAGQLGHGELPLRMAYVEGEAGVIAVERPRPDRQFVNLITALARTDHETRQSLCNMALPVCCLVKADGSVLWSDAATWPHLLAGGTTGGGKTVTIAGWLTSLMITVPPSQLRMTLVDLKAGSSFPWAKSVPHVDALLTTPSEVQQLVTQWSEEMDVRYTAFAEGGVTDLKAAMAAGWAQYPYRLLVIDEFKDLKDQMEKDDLKEMERALGRLVQKARGAGFFVWIATQHALAQTIDSTVKTNLDARLALKASSSSASYVILDDTGAETLLGNGDVLFRNAPGKPPVRGQAPLATENVWQAIQNGWRQKE